VGAPKDFMNLKFLKKISSKRDVKRNLIKIILIISFGIILFDSINNLHDKKSKILLKIKNNFLNQPKKDKLNDQYWAKKVLKGGYILHFRHTQREKWNDATGFDAFELSENIDAELSSFKKATCLTPQGIEEAKLIKNMFKILEVKISQVISSPSCRARMTAEYAFGGADKISNSLLHRTAMTDSQKSEMANNLKKLVLNLKIENEKNIVLSGHGSTIEDWYDGKKFIDENKFGDLKRLEGGFVVIEKLNNKLIAQYSFKTFSKFINSLIEFPIN